MSAATPHARAEPSMHPHGQRDRCRRAIAAFGSRSLVAGLVDGAGAEVVQTVAQVLVVECRDQVLAVDTGRHRPPGLAAMRLDLDHATREPGDAISGANGDAG